MPKPKQPYSGASSTPASETAGEASVVDSTLAEPASGVPSSIFRPGDDNIVRGEIVVKLSGAGRDSLTASIPTGPMGARTLGVPAGFGIPEVDEVLSRFGARSVTRLHPPTSPFAESAASDAELPQTFRVRIDPNADAREAVRALSETAAVAQAEPNRWREAFAVPNDPEFPNQWGLMRINCPAAWDITTGQRTVVVAVVDSGVDLDHPELVQLLLPGQDLVDLAGLEPPPGTHFEGDWLVRDDQPQDEVGHGTHVAGTIACSTNDAFGVAGVNWSCSILAVKVLTRVVQNNPPNRVTGVGSAVDIAAGIRWAVDHGARVTNLSLGGYNDTFVERDAVAYAVSKSVVVIAAMGNDNTNQPSFPAAYPAVIAVGATDPADKRAVFSNFGPHISVSAPGVQILSTVWNDGLATMQGTSMASPHVAGVAALMLSVNPNLTSDEVRTILRDTAQPLRDNPSDPAPNDRYGSGMIDAAAAVSRALQAVAPPVTNPTITRPTMLTVTRPTQTLPTQTLPTLTLTRPTLTLTRPTLTRPTLTLTQPTVTRPTLTQPTLTRPTLTLTRPTLTQPTFTRPTLTQPTVTRPTLTQPTLTRPTLTLTRPTLTQPTFTRPTLTQPTVTRPTLTLTRPTLTQPTLTLTRPTLTQPTLTQPTLTLTRPTLTQPTLTRPTLTLTQPTLTLTRPTLTQPTLTQPTLTLTRPTLTQPTLTQPTLTRPTLTLTQPTLTLTRPTLTQPTLTQPTLTRPTLTLTQPTRPTITGTIPPGPIQPGFGATGYEAYDPYGSAAYDPYGAGYADPYAGAGYEGYYDPYGGTGYESYYDPYSATGYEGYDPYGGAGYEGYGGGGYEAYGGTGYEGYGGTGYEGYYDPYGGTGYEGYESYYDPYAATGYESYYDPYGYGATGYESYYDPYSATGYEGYYDPYGGA